MQVLRISLARSTCNYAPEPGPFWAQNPMQRLLFRHTACADFKNFLRLTSIALHAGCLFIAGVEINSNNPVLFASNQCPEPMTPY